MDGTLLKAAAGLHSNVPPDWYERSIRENILQRFWHRCRFREVTRAMQPMQGGRILDIGSADGTFTNIIAKITQAKEIIGVDVLQSSIDFANLRWKGTSMHFECGDGQDLHFLDSSFDAVFALEVLEHVFYPNRVFSEVRRVLKPNGYAIFLVPSDNFLFRIIWWGWTRSRGGIWNDCHIQTFRGCRLSIDVKAAGLKIDIDRTFLFGMLHLVRAHI